MDVSRDRPVSVRPARRAAASEISAGVAADRIEQTDDVDAVAARVDRRVDRHLDDVAGDDNAAFLHVNSTEPISRRTEYHRFAKRGHIRVTYPASAALTECRRTPWIR
ncbi:hypothetical protein GCM10010272_30350 [Streptomyces lateritius]|nr:hypothetical protein GCM10010272_30350 [Streptomyces lateritius]